MLILHKSLKRSDDIIKSFRRMCEVDFKEIDGIIEVFNNKIGQGYLLKIFSTYNNYNDLVIWIYESLDEKKINVAFSSHANVDANNNWIDVENVNFKKYSIIKDIKIGIINDIKDIVGAYYGLNDKIEHLNGISI